MFKKLDVKKIRIGEDPPANSANPANQIDGDPTTISKISGISNPIPLNSHFCEEITPDREGPPYPDGLARVKCFYCENCEITGTKATCRVSRESRAGTALLITCSDFTMTTVH